MENERELQSYLQAVRQRAAGAAGPHVGLEELMAYQQSAVGEERRREIQRHLAVCLACLGEFREGMAFFRARAELPALGPAVGARVWEACWQRVQREDGPVAVAPPPEPVGFWARRRMQFALVASVVVALGMGVWGGWLEWENRELVGQVQRGTEQLKGVEGENRRLQEQLQGYERELAARRAPGVNRAIYDLLPQDAMTRGEAARAYQITFPPGTKEVVLILHPSPGWEHREYRLEIREEAGEVQWQEVGVRLHQGVFVVTLERGYLERGRYRLVLSGGAGGQWREIAAYAVVIE